jgi:hypothetical protein
VGKAIAKQLPDHFESNFQFCARPKLWGQNHANWIFPQQKQLSLLRPPHPRGKSNWQSNWVTDPRGKSNWQAIARPLARAF